MVCDFCEEHLEANKAAFADPRLQLVVDDARAQLEKWPGTFDVIIGDLADPVYGGPCYQVSLQKQKCRRHTEPTIGLHSYSLSLIPGLAYSSTQQSQAGVDALLYRAS